MTLLNQRRNVFCAMALAAVCGWPVSPARADIFEWTTDSSGNVVQSSTVCPGGSGVDAVPGANLNSLNLTQAYLLNSDLTNVNLSSGTLTNANLTNANLTGASIIYSTLTNANLTDANLTNAYLYYSTLTNANFAGATVAGADFGSTSITSSQLYSTASYQARDLHGVDLGYNNLMGWNLAGQDITGANLSATSLTSSQVYSTASYQAKSLQGVGLGANNLTGWSFAGQNLTNASFYYATLADADFTGATIAGASFYQIVSLTSSQLYSTASYQAKNLQGVGLGANNLAGWNFAGQDLTNTNFDWSTLTNANFTGASVAGASFANDYGGATLTFAQLYSTASYKAKDLHGIGFYQGNLMGWNFAGQNLTGANLSEAALADANLANANLTSASLSGVWGYSADLSGANLTKANLDGAMLTNANLSGANLASTDLYHALLTNANLTDSSLYQTTLFGATLIGADLRGAIGFVAGSAITTNTIFPDGTIQGLNLDSGSPTLLLVRNYFAPAGGSSIPIQILTGMSMDSNGTLQFQFDGNPWGSTISFQAGIPVTLGGNLELGAAPGVSPTALVGNTVQLFNWTGVSPSGSFSQIVSDPMPTRYSWNTSALYTLGQVGLSLSPITITGQWANSGTGGNWCGSGNWTGGNVPGAPQDAAVFGPALTSGTATVTLDCSLSLASLGFSTSGGASYVISSTDGNTLTLANSAGAATISNSGGNHTINVPILLGSNLAISASAGSILNLVAAIGDNGGGDSLSLDGGGQLILSGPNSYSGGTTVLSGTLEVTNAAALPSTDILTVGGDPQVVLVSGAGMEQGEGDSPIFTAAAKVGTVPEPSTLALLAVGAVGWLGYARRRRKAA